MRIRVGIMVARLHARTLFISLEYVFFDTLGILFPGRGTSHRCWQPILSHVRAGYRLRISRVIPLKSSKSPAVVSLLLQFPVPCALTTATGSASLRCAAFQFFQVGDVPPVNVVQVCVKRKSWHLLWYCQCMTVHRML